jgi:hypothetical protein
VSDILQAGLKARQIPDGYISTSVKKKKAFPGLKECKQQLKVTQCVVVAVHVNSWRF